MPGTFGGLTIYCDSCGTPVLRMVGDTLVIVATHHSVRHVTMLSVAALARLAAGERSPELLAQVRYGESSSERSDAEIDS